MSAKKYPVTEAMRWLDERSVNYEIFQYKYEPRGGTKVASRELGFDEHLFVKTLIMQDEESVPLVVLMHGDLEVSTKQLARHIGCKTVSPCKPEIAQKHSGYMVGGTSPFGTRKQMRVFVEISIFELDKIFINAGRRGLMLQIDPQGIETLEDVQLVDVGIKP